MTQQKLNEVLAELETVRQTAVKVRGQLADATLQVTDLRIRLNDALVRLRQIYIPEQTIDPRPAVDRIPHILTTGSGGKALTKDDIRTHLNEPDNGTTFVDLGYVRNEYHLRMLHYDESSATRVRFGCRRFESAEEMRRYYQHDRETSDRSGAHRPGIQNVIDWLADYAKERGWDW